MSETEASATQYSTDEVLSVRQQTAMLALLSGQSQREAALAAGVTEGTLSRWVHNDVTFRQLYATRKADVWKANEAKIAALAARALKKLDYVMMSGEDTVSLEAIKVVLRMTGLLPTGTRIASFGGQVNVGEQQVNIQKDGDNAP